MSGRRSAGAGLDVATGWRVREDPERGSVTVVMPILAVGMLAMAGLVVDGGAALAARGRAADVAQQAARAGADALAPGSLRSGDPDALVVDPAAGVAAAGRVLAASGVVGQTSVTGDEVTVTTTITRPTAMLSAVGLDSVAGRASATATVLYGGFTDSRDGQDNRAGPSRPGVPDG